MGVCQGVCGGGLDLHDRADRHQFHRPDRRENPRRVYARRRGVAGVGAVSVPR